MCKAVSQIKRKFVVQSNVCTCRTKRHDEMFDVNTQRRTKVHTIFHSCPHSFKYFRPTVILFSLRLVSCVLCFCSFYKHFHDLKFRNFGHAKDHSDLERTVVGEGGLVFGRRGKGPNPSWIQDIEDTCMRVHEAGGWRSIKCHLSRP